MRRIHLAAACFTALLLSTTLALAADWNTGKLMDTEKQEVPSSSTTTYNSDKNKDGRRVAHTSGAPFMQSYRMGGPSRSEPVGADACKSLLQLQP